MAEMEKSDVGNILGISIWDVCGRKNNFKSTYPFYIFCVMFRSSLLSNVYIIYQSDMS